MKEDKEKAKQLLKPRENEKRSLENKEKSKESSQSQTKKEFEHKEYYLKQNFESVTQAMDLFKDDPLIFKPGKNTCCVFLQNHSDVSVF